MKNELLKRYPALSVCSDDIDKALGLMRNTYLAGGTIYVCGNGGSCSDSAHIVGELMKGFLLKRPVPASDKESFEKLYEDGASMAYALQRGIPAVDLTAQSAILSAFNNDVDPEMCYAQLVYGYGKPCDLLIGLSTSGNSGNVVKAVKVARMKGMKTLALTGECESKLSALCDCTVRVPEKETFKIQEYHLPVYHYLCGALECELFGEDE